MNRLLDLKYRRSMVMSLADRVLVVFVAHSRPSSGVAMVSRRDRQLRCVQQSYLEAVITKIVEGAHKVLLEVVVDVACHGLCKMVPGEMSLKSSQAVLLGDVIRLVPLAFNSLQGNYQDLLILSGKSIRRDRKRSGPLS